MGYCMLLSLLRGTSVINVELQSIVCIEWIVDDVTCILILNETNRNKQLLPPGGQDPNYLNM